VFQPQSLRMTSPFCLDNDISNVPFLEGLLHLVPIVRFVTIFDRDEYWTMYLASSPGGLRAA
jgi:hypothetical protein